MQYEVYREQYTYLSLSVTVAQYKNCPFGINTMTAKKKNIYITATCDNNGI